MLLLEEYLSVVKGHGLNTNKDAYFGGAVSFKNPQDIFITVGASNANYITDGTADDVQINAAISAATLAGGGTVFIKSGTYNIANRIIPHDNVIIRGDGMFTTTLAATDGLHAGIIDDYAEAVSGRTNLVISDIELDGTGFSRTSGQYYKGINSRNWTNCHVFNVYCHDCTATGIGPDNLYQSTIDRCVVINNGTAGFTLGHNGIGIASGGQTSESVIVSNCVAMGNADNDYLIEADTANTGANAAYLFFDNISITPGQHSFRNSGTPNVSFINNYCYAPTKSGVFNTNATSSHLATNTLVKNNIIVAPVSYGIYISVDSADYNIEGNLIHDGQVEGIIAGCGPGSIINNHVHDNGKYGINLGTFSGATNVTSDVLVSGNLVYNNGKLVANTDGIFVTASVQQANNITITNNRCFDNQGVKTQRYGILLSSNNNTMSGILVANNNVTGNSNSAGLLKQNTSSGISIKNNFGANPENLYAVGTVTGSPGFNRQNGSVQTVTLGGNITPSIVSGVGYGDILTLEITQDATGSRTLTWPANFKKAAGSLVLTTTAAATDIVSMFWDGTNWIELSRALNVS